MRKMSDGVLSQEEIDALLRSSAIADTTQSTQISAQSENITEPANEVSGDTLNDLEKDAVGEVANIIMGSAATALSALLGRRVEITAPVVSLTDPDKFRNEYPLPYMLVNVEYTTGLRGANLLFIKNNDACLIVDIMMGGDGQSAPVELNDMHLSAISEAMNQMMGSASTALSTIISERVEISPPSVETVNFATDELKGTLGVKGQVLVKVAFKMSIEGLVDSEIMQLIPINLAKSMVKNLMDEMEGYVAETAEVQDTPEIGSNPPNTVPVQEPVIDIPAQVAAAAEPVMTHRSSEPLNFGINSPVDSTPVRPVSNIPEIPVQPVQFAPLQPNFNPKEIANIDLIMDVPLQITVELGKSKKTIREILALGPGSVIELDKLAGEPVDLLVNGKLLAKGEVVVIDENFGIRVTDIISPIERVTNLQ